MICAFVDLSPIDESSGVMVYALDPLLIFSRLSPHREGKGQGHSYEHCCIDVQIQLLPFIYGENDLEAVAKINTPLAPPFSVLLFHIKFSLFFWIMLCCVMRLIYTTVK